MTNLENPAFYPADLKAEMDQYFWDFDKNRLYSQIYIEIQKGPPPRRLLLHMFPVPESKHIWLNI